MIDYERILDKFSARISPAGRLAILAKLREHSALIEEWAHMLTMMGSSCIGILFSQLELSEEDKTSISDSVDEIILEIVAEISAR